MMKDTIKSMHHVLDAMKKDLQKAERGNKTASQRVRTGSIKFAKIAKTYRKESVEAEKKASKKPLKKKQKTKVKKR